MKILYLFCFATAIHAADRWYEIRIADQPAGYQHSTSEVLADGAIRSIDDTVIVINRLGSKVEIRIKDESLENAEGDLIKVREETTQSQQAVITEAELKGDRILLRSSAGSNSYDRTMPLKAPVCGPAAYARRSVESLKKAGDEVSCRIYTPSFGAPYKATHTLLAVETAGGQRVLRVKTGLDGVPGELTELLDSEGLELESEREMPFGKMVVRAADQETALRGAAGAELPAESFDRTMARSNVRFADARAVERVKLKLTHKKPELGWPDFASPMQTVLEKTPSTLVLEVRRIERASGQKQIDEAPFLRPNQILQSDDPEVLRLAQSIAGGESDRFKAARKLQDWVAANMKFDLGVALTPASEVVRNRRGTCMAYSVLLASMARALGIPSRLAGGFIYVYGIWGGHAWVEVLVDNQWLPLDAAGYRPGLADAARIQFGSYTAENNLAAFIVSGSQMYGNVEVEVLEYSVGGKTDSVAHDGPAYAVESDEYRNPGLGISIRKPEGFTFGRLDRVYPDPTIVTLERGSSKVSVVLEEAIADSEREIRSQADQMMPGAALKPAKLGGREAVVISSGAKARIISREGQSLWILTSEGPDAASALGLIAERWRWTSQRQ